MARISKASEMVRIPNELIPHVKAIVSSWRSTGELPSPPRSELPEPYNPAWSLAVGAHADFFQQWALTSFLLRWGFVDPLDCSMLPWIVRSGERSAFELAATAEAAVELARSEGLDGGEATKGWM